MLANPSLASYADASQRMGVKASHTAHGRADRLNAAKQQRDKKRAQLLETRRVVGPPRVVALLPLSADVHVQRVWSGLLAACSSAAAAEGPAVKSGVEGMDVETASAPLVPYAAQTVCAPDRRRVRFTFLPPAADRSDPLAVVELGRCAEVVLLLLPGGAHSTAVDADGLAALSVLRALGMPSVLGLVQTGDAASGAAAAAGLKERSAAKKRAMEALLAQVSGDHRVMAADSQADFKQVVRQLADSAPVVPHWRRQRPQLLADAAEFVPGDGGDAATGTLVLSGYIRGMGLSTNQLIHVPTAGDFQIDQIDRLADATRSGGAGPAAMETEGSGALGAVRADPATREQVVRENEPDLLDAEQTWPTEEELAEAEAARAKDQGRRRRLPKGTSEYQAAWIMEGEYGDDDDDEALDSDDDGADLDSLPDLQPNPAAAPGPSSDSGDDAWQNADAGTEAGMEVSRRLTPCIFYIFMRSP
jgi:pre-rRNA-processing protein TSR1